MAENLTAGGMAVEFETLQWRIDEAIGIVTINRPDALNALTNTVLKELRQVVEMAAKDDGVRVLVLIGTGRGFSAGQDLKEHLANNGALNIGEHLRQYYNPLMERLYHLEKPTVAAVNGVAAGAGMSLALAADFRIASDAARFVQAFVRIGLVPDSGSTYLLPLLVGRARAMELAMLGDTIDAETALAYGLVNRVVSADALMEEVMTFSRRLAGQAPKALGLIKRGIQRGMEHGFDEALGYEAFLQAAAAATADHAEGVRAFMEKRAPRFTGQ